jgi:Na+-translocating ferredoxin:NAD+ oxidoreductase RnfC subunit
MPHKVMRSLGFTLTGASNWNQWAELCCACGLCTLYACPEDLFPKEACDQGKQDLKEQGIRFVQKQEPRVHPMKEHRRVPLSQLRSRLKVEDYERETPYKEVDFAVSSVRILLSQHVGKPAMPTVKEGESVDVGDMVGKVAPTELGVNIHASIAGTVREVTEEYVVIEA